MLKLQKTDDVCEVYQRERSIGSLRLYNNPCHTRNCYIKPELEQLNTEISAELFKKLREMEDRPLQVMVESDESELIAFLRSGGFTCRRKCYEVEACREDYIGGQKATHLDYCRNGEPDYEKAARLIYAHYVETHRAVNPWTADFEAFCGELPEEVICSSRGGEVVSAAFIEKNEIAYVCGADEESFEAFARSLVCAMLEKHETICFESDDCDQWAMRLRSLFKNQEETSFDTYIY